METLKIRRDSWLYKIAKFGGFVEYQASSCHFINRVLLGMFVGMLTVISAIGFVMNFILGLVALGMPHEAYMFLRSSVLITVLFELGLAGYILMTMFVVFMILLLIQDCILYINTVIAKIFAMCKFKNLEDHFKGICKPVKIID